MTVSYLEALAFEGVAIITPPLTATRGRPFSAQLIFRDVNLTGASAIAAQVRAFPDAGGAALASMTIPAPVLSGTTDTLFSLSLDAGATGSLPAVGGNWDASEFAFDLIATVAGQITTLCAGKFIANGRVTQ